VDSVSVMNLFAEPRAELKERRWAKNGYKKGGCGRASLLRFLYLENNVVRFALSLLEEYFKDKGQLSTFTSKKRQPRHLKLSSAKGFKSNLKSKGSTVGFLVIKLESSLACFYLRTSPPLYGIEGMACWNTFFLSAFIFNCINLSQLPPKQFSTKSHFPIRARYPPFIIKLLRDRSRTTSSAHE
jgi:hypothetical protein